MMNRLLERLKNNQPIVNGWLSEASAFKAELMAKQGFHSITVDLQHGLQDYGHMVQAFQGLYGSPVAPMVRVAWNHPDQIMKALDAGALGVICPMVNNKEEAERFAEALYYPPKGARSFGPIRAAQIYDDYFTHANETIIGFAMIETEQAVNNIDEILAVKGINGLYIGPSDLSLSSGFAPGFDRTEKEMVETIEYILAKGKEYQMVSAIHTDSADYAIKMLQKGFNMITLSSDIRAMVQGLQAEMNPLKDFLQKTHFINNGL